MNHRGKREGYSPLRKDPPATAKPPPPPAPVGRRTISPGGDQRRAPAAPRASWGQLGFVPGQTVPAPRQKDKYVSLPDEDAAEVAAEVARMEVVDQLLIEPNAVYQQTPSRELTAFHAATTMFEDLPRPTDDAKRGRITLYCIAESLDRKKLDQLLRATYPDSAIKPYPDVFYLEYQKGDDGQPGGDVFFFDYGVISCWGLTELEEISLVRSIGKQSQEQPLNAREVEIDELQFNYSGTEKPHIQNDTVTLHKRLFQEHKVKLAISYALSQSTKLSVHEKRVMEIVSETKHLPQMLAETGQVHMSSHAIAKLIGKVFIQKSAVNLLSSVLDTPEFFWHAPDSLQSLYERICEYLELECRVQVLNSRFQVLQQMLDMLRDHQNNHHGARLEWIVIWLIVVEVLVGLMELLGLFGWVGAGHA